MPGYKSVVPPRGQHASNFLNKAFTFSVCRTDGALQSCWGVGRDSSVVITSVSMVSFLGRLSYLRKSMKQQFL